VTDRLIFDDFIITPQAAGTSTSCYPVPPYDPSERIGKGAQSALAPL